MEKEQRMPHILILVCISLVIVSAITIIMCVKKDEQIERVKMQLMQTQSDASVMEEQIELLKISSDLLDECMKLN